MVIEIYGEEVGGTREDTSDVPAPHINQTEYLLVGERIDQDEKATTRNPKTTTATDYWSFFSGFPAPPPLPPAGELRETLLKHVQDSECPECRNYALEYYRESNSTPGEEEANQLVNRFQSNRAGPMKYEIDTTSGSTELCFRNAIFLTQSLLFLISVCI